MIFSPPRPSRRPDLPLTLSPVRSPVILDRAFSEIKTLGDCQWRRFGADLTCCDLRFVCCLQARRSMFCCCGGRSVSSEFLRLVRMIWISDFRVLCTAISHTHFKKENTCF